MGALILPARFTQQPQQAAPIDRANPLSSGLAHCWGINAIGARQLLDSAGSANGVFGTGNPGTYGNSWQAGTNGYFINFSDAGSGSYDSVALKVGDAAGSGSPGSPTFSFITRLRLSTLTNEPGTGPALAVYGSGPSGSTGGIEIRIDGSTGRFQLLRQSVELIGESNASIPVGVDTDIGVSYDGSTVRFYINGVPAGSTAASGKTFIWARQHYLGYAGLVTTERLPNNSRIYRADVWARALSASEFSLWSQNPWQVFKSPPEKLYVAAPGGATNTPVSPASGSVSITGFAPTVLRTAAQSVFPASGSVAISGYSPTVVRTANQVLSPTNGAVTFAGYAPTISQAVNLAVSPASGAVSITGFAPTIARTNSTLLAPSAGSVSVLGYAPNIVQTSARTVLLTSGALTVSGFAPTISQTAPIITVKYRFISLKRDYNTDTINFSG